MANKRKAVRHTVVVGGVKISIPKAIQAPPAEKRTINCFHKPQWREGDLCTHCNMVKWEKYWFTQEELSEEFVERKIAEYKANPQRIITYRDPEDISIRMSSSGRLPFALLNMKGWQNEIRDQEFTWGNWPSQHWPIKQQGRVSRWDS